MIKKVCIVLIFTALVSCSRHRIIPEKTLAEIIYRMQITDAVLSSHESSVFHRDSMRIYEPVVEKFGYSLDDLRRTFLKYAAQDGKLQSVHDQVAKKIANEKNIYQPLARIEKLSENMNVGADSIAFVSRTPNKHNIEVRLSEQGVYDVSASYLFYKNDSTKNPKMAVWLESRAHKDSIVDRQEINLVKDTVFTDYLIRVKFNNLNFNILKIYWMDFDKEPDLLKRETLASLPKSPANNRIVGSRKKPGAVIKPDTTIRQHFIVKRMSVKYNFEESDTTRMKEKDEFVGPMPYKSGNDSVPEVVNSADSAERIIRRRLDSPGLENVREILHPVEAEPSVLRVQPESAEEKR